jgi:hypothetical protein
MSRGTEKVFLGMQTKKQEFRSSGVQEFRSSGVQENAASLNY